MKSFIRQIIRFKNYLGITLTDWLETLKHSPIRVMILAAVLLAVFNIGISWKFYATNSESFFVQVLAESHGMVLDILVLGALLLWVNNSSDRRRTIDSAFQEISDISQCLKINDDDCFNEIKKLLDKNSINSYEIQAIANVFNKPAYHDSYACLRIIRNIRTLNRYNITRITLDRVELPKAALSRANLSESSLTGFRSMMSDLPYSNFSRAILNSANFSFSDLTASSLEEIFGQNITFTNALMIDANLKNSKLINANFRNTRLNGASLEGSDLLSADFTGAHLVGTNFIGCQNLKASQLLKAERFSGCLLDEELRNDIIQLREEAKLASKMINIPTIDETDDQLDKPYISQKLAG